jgi:HD-like signal output (HDOD) protein
MEHLLLLLVLILGLLLLLVVVLLGLTRRSKTPAKTGRSPLSGRPSTSHIRKYSGKGLNTEIQRQAVLEQYPALKDIPYLSIAERPLPDLQREHEADFLFRIKEKFSEQKPLFLNFGDLLNLLRSPDSNLGEITSLVSTNPLFSAKILQVVNSAYFGFREKINSVGRAITLLGYNNVKSLVLQDYLRNVIPKAQEENAEIYARIWVHSAIVSSCSGYFAQHLFQLPPYEFGTIGLLHDIGKYFLPSLEPQAEGDPDLSGIGQEEWIYGLNHALMGSLITEKWELSESITNCVKYHHHPFFLPPESLPEPYRKPSFALALADLVTKVLGYTGNDEDLFPILDEYYQLFGLTPELPDIITPSLVKELEKARLTVLSYIHTITA